MTVLRVGDSGPLVGKLHQDLLEAGEGIEASELTGSVFGQSTYTAVRAFQAHHVGPDGHALSEDGIAGPMTLWAMAHGGLSTGGRYTAPGWRYRIEDARAELVPVIEAAVGEIGNFEDPDGSNSGPKIDKYGARGQAWCAYFVSWAMNRGPQGSPFGILGSALKLYEWSKRNNRILSAADVPQPGDVGIILRGDGHGHVELIVGLSDDRLSTHDVGGNVGNAVRGTIRPIAGFSAIARPVAG
jgi:peptidoglycan hydrolase-like protein with peptidoglycan-binding domain